MGKFGNACSKKIRVPDFGLSTKYLLIYDSVYDYYDRNNLSPRMKWTCLWLSTFIGPLYPAKHAFEIDSNARFRLNDHSKKIRVLDSG